MAHVISFVVPQEYIDCYNHVHYKDYLNIFQNARMEFLAKRGISLTDLERENIRLVTRRIEIEYIHELLLGDSIKIYTDISRIGRTSVVFSQSIVRGDDGTATTCKQVFVLIDGTTRLKIAIPEELCVKLLSEYLM